MTFQEINYFLCHAICSPLLFEAMVQFQIIPSHYPLNAQLSLNPPYLHLSLMVLWLLLFFVYLIMLNLLYLNFHHHMISKNNRTNQ